jgi:hypothetical protein
MTATMPAIHGPVFSRKFDWKKLDRVGRETLSNFNIGSRCSAPIALIGLNAYISPVAVGVRVSCMVGDHSVLGNQPKTFKLRGSASFRMDMATVTPWSPVSVEIMIEEYQTELYDVKTRIIKTDC